MSSKNTKVILAFVPQWTPISPHFALPSLKGQLEGAGYSTEIIDYNIEFYNEILNEKYLSQALIEASENQPKILDEIKPYFKEGKDFSEYSFDVQNKMTKYSQVKRYMLSNATNLNHIIKFAKNAVEALKNKESFFQPEVLIKSMSVIDQALEIASLPYYPSKVSLDGYTNPFFKFNFETIKFFVFDKNTNIFIDYFEKKAMEIKEKNVEYVGISINSSSQIVAGLTLAHMLKKYTNAHINIGGNFFGRVADSILNNQEFFDLFAHSLLVEEGEKPVVDLADYIEGTIPIEEVSNLIYPKNGKIHKNEKKEPLKLNQMKTLNLDGFDLSKYFTPSIIMPIQSSRGCYWGKCTFCDQGFGQNFNVKKIEKQTAEFIELKEKYGIENYEFIDECISPEYLKEMAQAICDNDIKINYFIDARIESTFSYEILKKASDSGLKMALWGVESGSDRIMELINKGIDVKNRLKILKQSSDADIWNFAFIFFGFPAETKEDAQKTIDLIVENKDIIHSYGRSVFTMGKHAKIMQDPEKYGIKKIIDTSDEYMPSVFFESVGMDKDEMNEMLKHCTQSCKIAYNNPLWMYLRYREFLFLYLTKYSIKELSDYKLSL